MAQTGPVQIGPVQRQPVTAPPRFILQAGAMFCMPAGELGATDLFRGGGFATSDFGLGGRIHLGITREIAVVAGLSAPRFGYDTTMLEEQLGFAIENPKQGFDNWYAGARIVISELEKAISYLQGSVGRYRFESQATGDGDPITAPANPATGFAIGIGVMNRHEGPGIDVTFTVHFANIEFLGGGTMKTRWLSLSIMTGLAAGRIK
jgi:hypothetical protein